MITNVVLLNSDFTPLGVISWKKAIRLLVKGKAEVIKFSTKIIRNFDRTVEIILPEIMRLIKLIREVWKGRVPLNKRNVLIRDQYTCQYCGKVSRTHMSIDHVIPRSKGGKNTFDNLVTCCVSCNNKKDNRLPSEAKMYLKHQPKTPTIMEFLMVSIKNAGLANVLKEAGLA